MGVVALGQTTHPGGVPGSGEEGSRHLLVDGVLFLWSTVEKEGGGVPLRLGSLVGVQVVEDGGVHWVGVRV